MHVVDGMDGINDRFLANELAPIPGQSGAYNAPYFQYRRASRDSIEKVCKSHSQGPSASNS